MSTRLEHPPSRSPERGAAGDVSESAPHLGLVLLLFVASGCAALIYEIVWFQMLSLVIGSSAVSLGVILGVFMGGMCAGSLLLPRLVPPMRHPLRVYALLEAGIAGFALVILAALPHAGFLYGAIGGGGATGVLVRGLVSGLCLLPPTILMGATLPAMARWVEASPRGVSWLGLFYAGNTVGAVLGCVVAGFYLLRVHDTAVATWVAAALNGAVALSAFWLSKVTPRRHRPSKAPSENGPILGGAWPVYVTIALSGATALASEVVWTRLLSLLLGATVYTFSLILAVFLIGLAVGSAIGSLATRSIAHPRIALGLCQGLIVVAILFAAYSLTVALPHWPINPRLSSDPLYQLQIDFVRCLWVVFPAATLWGASFPLALSSVPRRDNDLGRVSGMLYAANTVGAIVGALGGSLVLIPWLGTQHAQRISMTASAVAALLVLVPTVYAETARTKLRWRPACAGLLGLVVLSWLTSAVPPLPPALVAWGHHFASRQGSFGEIAFAGEGMNSSMAVSRFNGVLNYHNAGKIQASSQTKDMRLQRMLGHLATLVPEHPRNVLVIGCGAGVTAGAVSIDPRVERETIAEIEKLVPTVVAKHFADQNFDVVNNPKVHVEIDDARHFVLTTKEKFDAVTSDPFDPWVKGAATLYTKEFFELIKKRLNPGGVITVFVQLYESSEAAVKSEVATFLEVFPHGMVFGNSADGQGYDIVLLGSADPIRIDIDAIEARLARPEYAAVKASLFDIGFKSAPHLLARFVGRRPELRHWLEGAEINRDRNLRLQYLAGLSLNAHEESAIYDHMTEFRRYPDDLFLGAPERLSALKAAMAR